MKWVKVKNKVRGYTFERYQISDQGDLRDTITGKIRRKNEAETGNYYALYPDQHTHGVKDGIGMVNITVTTLMAVSFGLKKKDDTYRAMHKNGNKYDDRLENICYQPVGNIISKCWEKKKEII